MPVQGWGNEGSRRFYGRDLVGQPARASGSQRGQWQPARPVAASADSGSQRGQWQPARTVAASADSGSQRGQWLPARLACRRS
ncbi:unnamed protein product [Gadus morhua 'NCC']